MLDRRMLDDLERDLCSGDEINRERIRTLIGEVGSLFASVEAAERRAEEAEEETRVEMDYREDAEAERDKAEAELAKLRQANLRAVK